MGDDEQTIIRMQSRIKAMIMRRKQEKLKRSSGRNSPFVPSSADAIMELVEFAGLSREDVFLDIGSGDGRVVLEVAKRANCKAVGVEIDESLFLKANARLAQEEMEQKQLDGRVKFIRESLQNHAAMLDILDQEKISIVYVFLLPIVCQQVGDLLRKWTLAKEGRCLTIVSLGFQLSSLGIQPLKCKSIPSTEHLKLFLYRLDRDTLTA